MQARYWDLASGEQLQRLVGHTDYIRAAVQNPASPSIWATGKAPPPIPSTKPLHNWQLMSVCHAMQNQTTTIEVEACMPA